MSLERKLKQALDDNDQSELEIVFEEIYQSYYKLIYYIVIGIVKNNEDCEDIVNNVFLKAFNNLDKFDTNSSIKSWIVRIAKNESMNLYNQKKNQPITIDNQYINKQQASSDKFIKLIEEFKSYLTEEELDILIFKINYDLKWKDIAQYFNTTTNVVYKKYLNALKKLKLHYKRGDFDE